MTRDVQLAPRELGPCPEDPVFVTLEKCPDSPWLLWLPDDRGPVLTPLFTNRAKRNPNAKRS